MQMNENENKIQTTNSYKKNCREEIAEWTKWKPHDDVFLLKLIGDDDKICMYGLRLLGNEHWNYGWINGLSKIYENTVKRKRLTSIECQKLRHPFVLYSTKTEKKTVENSILLISWINSMDEIHKKRFYYVQKKK